MSVKRQGELIRGDTFQIVGLVVNNPLKCFEYKVLWKKQGRMAFMSKLALSALKEKETFMKFDDVLEGVDYLFDISNTSDLTCLTIKGITYLKYDLDHQGVSIVLDDGMNFSIRHNLFMRAETIENEFKIKGGFAKNRDCLLSGDFILRGI